MLGSFVFRRYIKTPTGHQRWDALKLRFPVFGNLFLLVGVARFTKTLSTLLASTIAHDKPHPLAEPFSLERFHTGRLVDEGAAAGVSH